MQGKCPYCDRERMELFEEISDDAIEMAKEFCERSIMAKGMVNLLDGSRSKEEAAKLIFLSGASQMLSEYIWNEHETQCKLKNQIKD